MKGFLMKQMLKRQLKDLPESQRDQIIALVESNPELFQKIGTKVQERVKKGEGQQQAALAVFKEHEKELRDAMQS